MKQPAILMRHLLAVLLAFNLFTYAPVTAQQNGNTVVDTNLLSNLQYRMAGPFRGGRSTAVSGRPGAPFSFLMGTTGGGLWESTDAGGSWQNISDGFFGGGIGAVAVSEADPNVIYVGTGSADPRGNISQGRGIWKSTDGGKSWKFSGLPEAGQIGKIRIHPKDPDLVYVAALGHIFGPNPERGVYRSRDGGATWEAVLQVSDQTGAVSLIINPSNPRVLYAGMWRAERKPWSMISGSEDGGVYRSIDGGDTWAKLAGGLPTGLTGKIGLTLSPANPDRVWAIIEAEPAGGVYRSDDAGKTWTRINKENKLRQRAWYYTHMVADPQDENTVYALNTGLYRSVDGGKNYEGIPVPHGDVHDLWINPDNPKVMIVADDGGAQVTLNGGKTWSTYLNQPTAEIYGVVVDNGLPYRLYGAQQDNTTISIPAWSSNNTLHAKQHWYSVGGCETGPVALDPNNPNIVYAGCYGGVMDKYDLAKDQVNNIMAYPQLQLGEAAKNLKYRFQWVSPMAVSPHDSEVIYHGSQHVHQSKDGGKTWRVISPDLSTNTPEHLDYSGGPINHDITGVEIYNVVFEIVPDPNEAETIWAGTDDGRLHITRNDGANWQEITPPAMPKYGTVNKIDLSTHQAGRAFVAVHKYRFDDFAPYIFMTNDYGKSWKRITSGKNGIPADYPVRVVREDPERKGLLYAGTEFGLFVSFDEGAHWQPMQGDLPITPITDLRVHQGDLVMSTQGRSFWILDDLSPIREMSDDLAEKQVYLFEMRPAFKVNDGGAGFLGDNAPTARPSGALIHYALQDSIEGDVRIEVIDADARLVQVFSSDSLTAKQHKTAQLKPKEGLNRINWDLTYEGPTLMDGTIVWGYTGGVKAPPGTYDIRLTYGDEILTQQVEVEEDPRIAEEIDEADYEEQLRLGLEIRDAISAVHESVQEIRSVKEQISWMKGQTEDQEVNTAADSILQELTALEEQLIQTKNESNQDPIRFAPRLDNQLVENYNYVTGADGYISGGREGRPNAAAYERWTDLDEAWTDLEQKVEASLSESVRTFNELVRKKNIIGIKRKATKS
ncbi:WD40/YVTN/BNR-like repeat-containing protein [Flavilitoribacter nigricans]|uniref:Glycosyl hydrolase n=1 Tax=Flavilitoribacter nigricans (strain ATCC 23147 / DSM 23189 / NBRC 102662 / NCIMB 1420 / SS-2) TaxID=1122177 RepID=A0A2D0MZG0_FLAN2|nr:glycosyl hydrolase [Flavilitoribacter nigricans]PHN01664.1 glycosyl hydrolase [Flavilitoribacter nigricans DSM 23189 = NBRC 102662]